jgi:hypothetical protein
MKITGKNIAIALGLAAGATLALAASGDTLKKTRTLLAKKVANLRNNLKNKAGSDDSETYYI